METEIKLSENTELNRVTEIQVSDWGVFDDANEHNGARVVVTTRHWVRVKTGEYSSELNHLPRNESEFILTEAEIDQMIRNLTLAKSLLGSDFLIFGGKDGDYNQDGVQYHADGTPIE